MVSEKQQAKWVEVMSLLSAIIGFGPTDIDIWVSDRSLIVDGDKYDGGHRSCREWRLDDVDYVIHVADVIRYVLQGSCGVVTIRRAVKDGED